MAFKVFLIYSFLVIFFLCIAMAGQWKSDVFGPSLGNAGYGTSGYGGSPYGGSGYRGTSGSWDWGGGK